MKLSILSRKIKMWLEVSEGQGEGEGGRILEFWLGFPRRLRLRESCQQQKHCLSRSRGNEHWQDARITTGQVQVKPNSWTTKQQSVPPALLQIAQQQRNWGMLYGWEMWRESAGVFPSHPKPKAGLQLRGAPGKPQSHEGVFRKPGGRAERGGSAIRHTQGAQDWVTNGNC